MQSDEIHKRVWLLGNIVELRGVTVIRTRVETWVRSNFPSSCWDCSSSRTPFYRYAFLGTFLTRIYGSETVELCQPRNGRSESRW
jgi:hypothetical protein